MDRAPHLDVLPVEPVDPIRRLRRLFGKDLLLDFLDVGLNGFADGEVLTGDDIRDCPEDRQGAGRGKVGMISKTRGRGIGDLAASHPHGDGLARTDEAGHLTRFDVGGLVHPLEDLEQDE